MHMNMYEYIYNNNNHQGNNQLKFGNNYKIQREKTQKITCLEM
jgi:hypothetical protein